MNAARYSILFALQSAGIVIILWLGLPFYRQLALNPTDYPGASVPIVKAALAVSLIQVGFWINRRSPPAVTQRPSLFLRQVLLFLSRLNFGFAGSLFALVFYQRIQDVHFSPFGIALLLVVLFSIFCYSTELERLADLFNAPAPSRELEKNGPRA